MTQTISVSCKLQVPPQLRQEIDRTLQGCAEACNQIWEVAKRQNRRNATQLHHLTYYTVKLTTGLKANPVCQAIRRVVGNMKAAKQVHKFRPTSITLDAKIFTYRESDHHVGLTLMSQRAWLPLSIGNYQLARLRGQRPTSATLVKRRTGGDDLQSAVDPPPTGQTPKVLGVDRGRQDIATTSTNKAWKGSQLQVTRDRYARVRASLQSKRTREARFQTSINHSISRQLVNDAKAINAALALEDLTGICQSLNAPPRHKTERRWTNHWAFYPLRTLITYKAILAGVPVVFVPPGYTSTSQTCSRCHHIHPEKGKSYRNGKELKCGHCGLECRQRYCYSWGCLCKPTRKLGDELCMGGSTFSPLLKS